VVHGEKQYICKVDGCNKEFLDKSKLKRHRLVHTKERHYACEICGKKFSLDFNLRTHMRTHTGQKPFICEIESCGKRFSQSSNLASHQKQHAQQELLDKIKRKRRTKEELQQMIQSKETT
jgi:transcription factor YY